MTPFGRPVVPEEYGNNTTSSFGLPQHEALGHCLVDGDLNQWTMDQTD